MNSEDSRRRRSRNTAVGAAGLIDVAEALFAEHGIDNVSMRQIAASAGLSNPASVQYHFGDRDTLVRAIWQKRLPEIDKRRARQIAALEASGAGDRIDALMDCICAPLVTEFNVFSQFLARVMRSRYHRRARREFDSLTPATGEIIARMRALLPEIEDDVFYFRLVNGLLIVLDAIGSTSAIIPKTWHRDGKKIAYAEALAVAAGCLQASRPEWPQ